MSTPTSLPLLRFPTAWAWISFDGSGIQGVSTLILGAVTLLTTVLGGLTLVKRSRGRWSRQGAGLRAARSWERQASASTSKLDSDA